MPTRLRELGGNGPQGRRGAGAIIKGWRQALADIQNTELRRVGANKRYDPRSYRDQGVDRVPGQHVGTKRAALETSGRAVEHWSHACPEWTRVMAMIENNLEEWQATDPERDGVYEAIEEVRLEMGAHTPEGGAHLRAWGLRVRASLRDESRDTDIPEEGWQPQVLNSPKPFGASGANARHTFTRPNGKSPGGAHAPSSKTRCVWARSPMESRCHFQEIPRDWPQIHVQKHVQSEPARDGSGWTGHDGSHNATAPSGRARKR